MKRRILHTLLLLPLLGTAGCAHRVEPEIDLVWPAAPQEPRIEYQRSIYGTESLSRSFLGGVRDFLLGKKDDRSLTKPYGVIMVGSDLLYVADTGSKSIVRLDIGAGSASSFRSLGSQGSLVEPVNLILGPEGNL